MEVENEKASRTHHRSSLFYHRAAGECLPALQLYMVQYLKQGEEREMLPDSNLVHIIMNLCLKVLLDPFVSSKCLLSSWKIFLSLERTVQVLNAHRQKNKPQEIIIKKALFVLRTWKCVIHFSNGKTTFLGRISAARVHIRKWGRKAEIKQDRPPRKELAVPGLWGDPFAVLYLPGIDA